MPPSEMAGYRCYALPRFHKRGYGLDDGGFMGNAALGESGTSGFRWIFCFSRQTVAGMRGA